MAHNTDYKAIIEKLVRREDLLETEMMDMMETLMAGRLTDAQIGGFLVALRAKGEAVQEIAGAARVMRRHMTPVACERYPIVDTCGTGGDGTQTINISTAAAIIACASGVTIAKHGNRSVSSRSGSADVLVALGFNLDTPPELLSRALNEVGFAFLYAPQHHPAMKFAVKPRKELGIRTIFNILGPLTNPAGATAQLIGVFDRSYVLPVAQTLHLLGVHRALVVHGEDGLDELTTTAETFVAELKDGKVQTGRVKPEDFNLQRATLTELRGGEPHENAERLKAVLAGRRGADRDISVLNAGAAIYVAGLAADIQSGVQAAKNAIDRGDARKKLAELLIFGQD